MYGLLTCPCDPHVLQGGPGVVSKQGCWLKCMYGRCEAIAFAASLTRGHVFLHSRLCNATYATECYATGYTWEWGLAASTWHVLLAGVLQCICAVWALVCCQVPVRSAPWTLLLTGGPAEPPKQGGWGLAVAALCRYPDGGQQVYLVHNAAWHLVVGRSCVALVRHLLYPSSRDFLHPLTPPPAGFYPPLVLVLCPSSTGLLLCMGCAWMSVRCAVMPCTQHTVLQKTTECLGIKFG